MVRRDKKRGVNVDHRRLLRCTRPCCRVVTTSVLSCNTIRLIPRSVCRVAQPCLNLVCRVASHHPICHITSPSRVASYHPPPPRHATRFCCPRFLVSSPLYLVPYYFDVSHTTSVYHVVSSLFGASHHPYLSRRTTSSFLCRTIPVFCVASHIFDMPFHILCHVTPSLFVASHHPRLSFAPSPFMRVALRNCPGFFHVVLPPRYGLN